MQSYYNYQGKVFIWTPTVAAFHPMASDSSNSFIFALDWKSTKKETKWTTLVSYYVSISSETTLHLALIRSLFQCSRCLKVQSHGATWLYATVIGNSRVENKQRFPQHGWCKTTDRTIARDEMPVEYYTSGRNHWREHRAAVNMSIITAMVVSTRRSFSASGECNVFSII